MKKIKTMVLALSSICMINVIAANSSIEGQWKNEKAKVSVLVEKTYDGIRVKRLDRTNWIKYESTRANQFRDNDGNTYLLRRDGNLEWESYDGRRRIVFARAVSSSSIKPKGSTHIERNHYYGRDFYRSLEGKWINRSTGQSIWIKERRKSIRVKAHRRGWVTFRPRANRTFVDPHGNRYQVKNGRLSYTSYSGDFYMRFVKY